MPLLWARDSFGGILGDNLGEGNCKSIIVSRQWGANFPSESFKVKKALKVIFIFCD